MHIPLCFSESPLKQSNTILSKEQEVELGFPQD